MQLLWCTEDSLWPLDDISNLSVVINAKKAARQTSLLFFISRHNISRSMSCRSCANCVRVMAATSDCACILTFSRSVSYRSGKKFYEVLDEKEKGD